MLRVTQLLSGRAGIKPRPDPKAGALSAPSSCLLTLKAWWDTGWRWTKGKEGGRLPVGQRETLMRPKDNQLLDWGLGK